jgi:hypothetical protein
MSESKKDKHSERGAGQLSRRAQARKRTRILDRNVKLLAAFVCAFLVSLCALIETTVKTVAKPFGPDDRQLYAILSLFHLFLEWLRGHGIPDSAIRLVIASVAIVSLGGFWVVFRLLRRDGDPKNRRAARSR